MAPPSSLALSIRKNEGGPPHLSTSSWDCSARLADIQTCQRPPSLDVSGGLIARETHAHATKTCISFFLYLDRISRKGLNRLLPIRRGTALIPSQVALIWLGTEAFPFKRGQRHAIRIMLLAEVAEVGRRGYIFANIVNVAAVMGRWPWSGFQVRG